MRRNTNYEFGIIDYDTDAVIQKSLRQGLNKDVTLLVIAHRLQTIMDADKIVCPVSIKYTSLKSLNLRRWSWTLGALSVPHF